jgi:hypothetical protein
VRVTKRAIRQHAEEKDLSDWAAGSAGSAGSADDDAPPDHGASDEPDWLADWASKKVAGARPCERGARETTCVTYSPCVSRAAPQTPRYPAPRIGSRKWPVSRCVRARGERRDLDEREA